MKRMMFLLLLVLPKHGTAFCQEALEPVIIDQSGEFPIIDFPLFRPSYSIPFFSPTGQEFVPQLTSLNFVDFYTTSFARPLETGSLAVTIHSISINGPVAGRSLDVSLPIGFDGVTRFRFPAPVSLTPGERYVAEITAPASPNWHVVYSRGEDTYAKGSLIVKGLPGFEYITGDLWFREGLIVPEPSTMSLVVASAILVLAFQRRHAEDRR
jgi:hypothetical protein